MCKDFLDVLDHKGLFASNGQEAVEIYQDNWQEIDLIFLDMLMPIMDGKKALQAIIKINPEAKVVISSGFTADNSVAELISHGATGLIDKPFKLSEFKACIEEIFLK